MTFVSHGYKDVPPIRLGKAARDFGYIDLLTTTLVGGLSRLSGGWVLEMFGH
jgi:hypothetical protein